MEKVKVLKSFEDSRGIVSNRLINTYGSGPLDVMEQYKNKAKHMFTAIDEEIADIPNPDDKLQHISGIVINLDGDITDEYVGYFDMAEFDERMDNLATAKNIKVVTTDIFDLRVGDVIINIEDFTTRVHNG